MDCAILKNISPLVFSPKLFAKRQNKAVSQSFSVSCNIFWMGIDFLSSRSKNNFSCQFLKMKSSIVAISFSQKIHDFKEDKFRYFSNVCLETYFLSSKTGISELSFLKTSVSCSQTTCKITLS